MGKLLVANTVSDPELKLVQAFDVQRVGEDAGEVAGVGKTGVIISDNIDELNADVLIDFTVADSSIKNIKKACEKGVKLVVGTTGFDEEQWHEIESVISVPAVISPNFSIGVNIFWKILEFATPYLSSYDIEIVEIHHRFKKDSPSGTALKAGRLIKDILEKKGIKRELKFERSGLSPRGEEIGIFGIRGGDVVGEHTVFYFGNGERIEITHRALSRQAFASGAIQAAKWISRVEKPGIYTMDDVLGF
nr:4-hydroxy-tetrahydrodipicolinate reductase [Archaeoglobus sulfaticallidus]